jgi:ubiquinone/menaquinone biosynthesis C-methylase UbiE
VAEAYARFQATNGYAWLARDLVIALNLAPGAAVLDVGCGSGAGIVPAQEVVGVQGFVVGLDISLPMLRRAAVGGAKHLVAGIVPGLPFPECCFDRVAASLVLSHVEQYDLALHDMVRVLRPEGRPGVSAAAQVANRPNPPTRRGKRLPKRWSGERHFSAPRVPWRHGRHGSSTLRTSKMLSRAWALNVSC